MFDVLYIGAEEKCVLINYPFIWVKRLCRRLSSLSFAQANSIKPFLAFLSTVCKIAINLYVDIRSIRYYLINSFLCLNKK